MCDEKKKDAFMRITNRLCKTVEYLHEDPEMRRVCASLFKSVDADVETMTMIRDLIENITRAPRPRACCFGSSGDEERLENQSALWALLIKKTSDRMDSLLKDMMEIDPKAYRRACIHIVVKIE